GVILLQNVDSGERTELIRSGDMSVYVVRWTADGTTLIAAGGRLDSTSDVDRKMHGVIRFFDRTSGKMLREIDDDIGYWTALAVSADGRRLAATKADCVLKVWDLPSGEQIASVAHEVHNPHLAISTDGKLIATATDDGTVTLWNGETARLR